MTRRMTPWDGSTVSPQYDSNSVTVPTGESTATKTIAFPVRFTSPPTVLVSSGNSYWNVAANPDSVTATGFLVAVRQLNNNAITAAEVVPFTWSAFGA